MQDMINIIARCGNMDINFSNRWNSVPSIFPFASLKTENMKYYFTQHVCLLVNHCNKWPQLMTLTTGSNWRTGSVTLWPLRKLKG